MNFSTKIKVSILMCLVVLSFIFNNKKLNATINNDLSNLNNNKLHAFSPLDLPTDFPPISITQKIEPAPGFVLFPVSGKGYGSYIVMLDKEGNIINYKKTTSNASNLTLNSNGLFTFNLAKKNYFKAYSEARVFIADAELNIIDSIVSANGFVPAPHSSMILPNGNILYTSFESHHIDMSEIVEKGNPNAIVAGAVLVEIDLNKNVVFQWRSWDYIPISDTYQPINDFLNITTLYSNFNSVDVDFDGNYLLSNRLLSEITKIDRSTGEMIWRLGGKHNQFTFINENEENSPTYFSMQHDVRLLSNGNITIFDNADQHKNPVSRVVEYQLDELNKTATLVWEYKDPIGVFTASAGSGQRLRNGNTIIGWGNNPSASNKKDITEVSSDGTVQFEMNLPASVYTFKGLKFPYPITEPVAVVQKDELLPLNTYKFEKGDVNTGVTIVFSEIDGFMYNFVKVSKFENSPLNPEFEIPTPHVLPYKIVIESENLDTFEAQVRFDISNMEWMKQPEKFTVFVRETENEGKFIPLNTIYNPQDKQLIANTTVLGEFLFAKVNEIQKPLPPILNLPLSDEKINSNFEVKFNWSPRGYFKSSDLLVADNIDFNNPSISITDFFETTFISTNFDINKTYYWKVRIKNDAGKGEWSEVRTFNPSEPFLLITTPIGKEKWIIDSSYKRIRWDKNITDYVKIELYRNNEFVQLIVDSLKSYTGAYNWKIPSTIISDTTYKVKISTLNDESVFSISNDNFTITNESSMAEDNLNELIINFVNFPNPVIDKTTFEFNIVKSGETEISIYKLDGTLLNTIYSGFLDEGRHSIECSFDGIESGAYMYKVVNNDRSVNGNLILIR